MKINSLHYIRGLAALFVLFTHLVSKLTWDLESNSMVQMLASFGTEAVVVFFLLSGIVITHSTLSSEKISIKKYFLRRIKRIVPLTWVAIFLALIVYFILYHTFPSTKLIILNFLFLGTMEGFIIPVISTIDPLWSLSYELFFYLFFALFILKFGRRGFYVWLIISVVSILTSLLNVYENNYFIFINRIFAFSLIWLLGYVIYYYRMFSFSMIGSLQSASLFFMTSRVVLSSDYYEPLKWVLAAIVLVPLFNRLYRKGIGVIAKESKYEVVVILLLYTIVITYFNYYTQTIGYKYYLYMLLPLMPLVFYIGKVKQFFIYCFNSVKTILNFLGDVSFPVYIIHYPLLMLFNHLWDNTSILKPILAMGITFFSAVLLNKIINRVVA